MASREPGNPATIGDLIRRPETDVEALAPFSPALSALPPRDRRIVAETARFEGYVERQRRVSERLERSGALEIPLSLEFRSLSGLSSELTEKLERVRPETLGRAARIDGMTPAALALLAAHIERARELRAR
jgi:tRNA uridine 5-carboxymethylaminomethyl modification enzyme